MLHANSTTPCDVCGLAIVDDEIHWGHDSDCVSNDLAWCACDVNYHDACCPTCNPERNSTETLCPCGITNVADGSVAYSMQWHIVHERTHTSAFPNVDEVTRSNLADAIRFAR